MRTLAVLPIKSFDAAKQRLAAQLQCGTRRALAQAMFVDTLAALRRVRGVQSIAVVTSDPDAMQAARHPRTILVTDPRQSGQSDAAELGVNRAVEDGYARVLLVPGDTPMLDPAEIDAMLTRAEEDEVGAAIVPDRHGSGTNALLLAPPRAIAPSFGPGSRERHEAAAREAGVSWRIEEPPSLLHDVDTPDDLLVLAERLERRSGVAPMTRGALRQLERAHLLDATADDVRRAVVAV